ncbi:MAG: zinc-binding dehydrogenase [Bacteroidota bacterium]|nr:zinc-binding dehydrogenase [Bacteroidota bacterium]
MMNAIILSNKAVKLQQVPQPIKAEPEHLLVKMSACAINPGDKAFISRPLPAGAVHGLYNVYGVSGVGTVIGAGAGVPNDYAGKNVVIYRSLKTSPHILGTWSEYAQVHFLNCVTLPDDVNMDEYSGSLVNIITPYAFLKQIREEGHKGIISTAGNSATGIAMLGICLAYNFPLISIARTEKGKEELQALGAEHVLAQSEAAFQQHLNEVAELLSATAIFDGVGGSILNEMIDIIPNNSTIYSYGYLGGATSLSLHTSVLMRGITLRGFGNFRSKTVQDPQLLKIALKDIGGMIHQPHFKTKIGKEFRLEEINEALAYTSEDGAKAILRP